MTRVGNPGVRDSLSSGYVIGLPPVLNFAKVFYIILVTCKRKSWIRSIIRK